MTPHQRKTLVVGCGSIGMRHLRNLKTLGQREIAVCSAPERLEKAAKEVEFDGFVELAEALSWEPEVVIVCNTTDRHIDTALAAVRAKAHVLIEKPISHNLTGVNSLLQEAEAASRKIMVGYNMRFHPVLRKVRELIQNQAVGRILSIRAEMGQFLPTWRQGRSYQDSYSARRALGGGIILDMSHELDYLLWMLGPVKRIACFAGHLSSLQIDVEDIAAMLFEFDCGAVGEAHLDYVQRGYARGGKAIGEKGVIQWSIKEPRVDVIVDSSDAAAQEIRFDGYDSNEMYLAELEAFFCSIDRDQTISPSGRDGEKALRLALNALEATARRKVIDC